MIYSLILVVDGQMIDQHAIVVQQLMGPKMIIRLIVSLYIAFSFLDVQTQCVPNGGFEDVLINSTNPDLSKPLKWIRLHGGAVGIECFPFTLHSHLSTDSYSGDYAIEMETIECNEVGSGLVQRAGGIISGNDSVYAPYGLAQDCLERPEFLNLFYKLDSQDGDSAYVSVVFFNYDSLSIGIPNSLRYDTIAFSHGFIKEQSLEYVPYTLPIEYLSDSTPSLLRVYIGSGYNCHEGNCKAGTKLWVDDVTVSGGTLGIENEQLQEQIHVFPNPANEFIHVSVDEPSKFESISITDLLGNEIFRKSMEELKMEDSIIQLDLNSFSSGSYIIMLNEIDGTTHSTRFIID